MQNLRKFTISFSISAFIFLAFHSSVFAAPGTVSNTGNIEVRVQYKIADSDYQDMYLKPGESKELPGGVEKVKVVRNPGEWASPAKADETISVTVKEGDQVVGTAGFYGDKVFFSQPTASPTTQVTLQPEPTPPQTDKPVEKAETVPTTQPQTNAVTNAQGQTNDKPSDAGNVNIKSEPGSIANKGYLPMNVVFHDASGNTVGEVTVGRWETVQIPEGATGCTIRQPMVFSGYTFGLNAVDLKIVKPSGETTQVDEAPFEGAVINLGNSGYHYEYDWGLKFDSKLKLDAGINFGDDLNWKKGSKANSADAQIEDVDHINDSLRSLRFKD